MSHSSMLTLPNKGPGNHLALLTMYTRGLYDRKLFSCFYQLDPACLRPQSRAKNSVSGDSL